MYGISYLIDDSKYTLFVIISFPDRDYDSLGYIHLKPDSIIYDIIGGADLKEYIIQSMSQNPRMKKSDLLVDNNLSKIKHKAVNCIFNMGKT